MKVSYDWLKAYLKADLTPEQVAEAMTSIGIEVDALEQQEAVPGGLQGVVVAHVLTCEPHPALGPIGNRPYRVQWHKGA